MEYNFTAINNFMHNLLNTVFKVIDNASDKLLFDTDWYQSHNDEMERLSYSLQPHKELVGNVASFITILQFFSGAIICRDIYKKKTTQGIPSTPFIGGAVLGVLVLKYALLLEDKAMFQVNMAAIILNVAYVFCYAIYSCNRKNEVVKPLVKGLTVITVLLGYARWENSDVLEYRYGFIVTILMLLLLGSPLVDIKTILRSKNASSIPFPITIMGFFVSILWLIYGIILMNNFMIVQNVIGTILCFVQLVLYFMYPGNTIKTHTE